MGEARVQKRSVLWTIGALLVTGTAYFHGECLRSESRLAQLSLAAEEQRLRSAVRPVAVAAEDAAATCHPRAVWTMAEAGGRAERPLAVTGGPLLQARTESATGYTECVREVILAWPAADRRAGAFGKTNELDDAEAENILKEAKMKLGVVLSAVTVFDSERDAMGAEDVPLQARSCRGFKEVPGNRGTLNILEDNEGEGSLCGLVVYSVFLDPEVPRAWGQRLRYRGSWWRLPGG